MLYVLAAILKIVLFTFRDFYRCMIIGETKSAWYLIFRRLYIYIESLILLGSEWCYFFRKYIKHTLRGVALIDKVTPRGRSEVGFLEAEKISKPKLK